MTVEVRVKQVSDDMQRWLTESVGERRYYLHNRYGGVEWSVTRDGYYDYVVSFEDESLATEFILRWV